MQAKILIALDDEGKLSVATSINNPFLNLGLLEMAKEAVKSQIAQSKSQIEIPTPNLVVPR